MKDETRILIVEDLVSDYELAQNEIRRILENPRFERVEEKKALLRAIKDFQPDLILTDYNLPGWDGMKVLKLAQKNTPSTPVIIWTGSVGESVAVECIRKGASNFVLKESMEQLGPAVVHALEEKNRLLDNKLAEERYRIIFENSMGGVFQSTPEGRYVSVNPAMAHIYGYDSPQEMMESVTDISTQIYAEPEGRIRFLELLHSNNSVGNFEMKNLRRDGSVIWTSTSARSVRDETGKILYYEGFLQDITKRKEAEESLKNSESRFRALTENGLDSISLVSADGTLLWVTPSMTRILDHAYEKFIGRNMFELMHPEDQAWAHDLFVRLTQEPGCREHRSFRLRHSDGTWRWVEAVVTNLLDEPGVNAVVVNYRDITERKRAEDKLRESENRLILAMSAAQMSVWEWNLQSNDILWSPEFYAITGIEETAFNGTFEGYTDLIHPEDVERVRQSVEKALEENSMFAEEFRIIRPDGEVRWLSNLGHAEYGRSSKSLRMIGTVQDITARKQVEKERQALLEIMQGLASAKDLQEFLGLIHRSVGNVIFAENFFVVLHHRETGLFEEIYSVDQYDPPAPPSKLEKSITSYVFRTAEPLLLTQERFDELAAMGEVELVGTDSASWLGVPLNTPGGPIGVMVVQDYENQNRYSDHDKGFLISIASQASLAIERKQAELELQQKNDDLALLSAVNEAVVRGQDLDAIVELLAKELRRIFSIQGNSLYSMIYMLAPDRQSIRMQKYFFPPELEHRIESLIGFAIPTIEIPILEGRYFHRAMTARRSAIISDPQEIRDWISEFTKTRSLHPLVRAAVRRLVPQIHKLLNINSMIVVPLISDEETFGFLDVSSSGIFTAGDLKRISNIGAQLTAVIQRQQANEKVRRSEKFLQSIQNALSASIAILDVNGTIVQVNSAWREFGEQNGQTHPAYCVGLNYLEICDTASGANAEEAPAVGQAIRAVIAGQKSEARIEYPCHGQNGNRWFTLHITKFEDGDNTWVVLAHENITEQKLAEQTLIQSQARYQDLFDSSPIPLWEEDYSQVKKEIDSLMESGVADLRIYLSSHPEEVVRLASLVKVTDANKASVELFRATQKSELLKDLILLWGADNLGQFQEEILSLMTPQKRFSWEGPDHTLDGKPLEVIVNGSIPPGYEHDWSKVIVSISDITERKRAERALQQSENRYRTVVEHQTEFIVRWNPDGKRTFVNEAYCRYFGLTPEQALSAEFMPLVHEKDRQLVEEKISRLLSGAVSVETDIHRVITPDSDIGWQEWTDQAIYDENGNLIELQSIGRDITGRRRAEEAEHEQRALAEALRDTALILNSTLDFGEVLDHILSAVGSVVPHDAATIMLIEGDSAHVARSHGYDVQTTRDEILGYRLLLTETPNLRKMLETRQPEIIHDTHLYTGWHRTTITDWLRSNVGAPISIHGKVIGFILLDSATVGFFTPIHAERLEAFANQAALAIRNANVLQQAQDEIAERKRAEEKLRASEERFRQMAENIEEVFWMTDARSGRELYMSPACETVWGRSVEYLMQGQKAFIDCILPEDLPIVLQGLEREKEGEKVEMEYRIVRPDGTVRWVWDRAFPILGEDGKVKTLAGIAADITERKLADEALRESEERFSSAFEFAPIGIALVSLEGRWLKVNRSLCNLVGYTDQELVAKTFQEITHPEDLDADLDNLNRLLAGEISSYQTEKRYIHKSREVVWVLLSVSLLKDREGSPKYFISQIQDITQRKRVEQEVRRRARETSALLETSQALTNLDLNAILHSVGNSAKTLFAADGCRIFLMQPDGESLRCVLALQEDFVAFSDLRVRLGDGVTGAVAASGQAEIVNQMQNDPRGMQVPGTPEEEEAIMFAPLKQRDQTIGVLSVRRAGADYPFEQSDLELLEAFASMAASAVSNARLFQETQRRLAELEALYENGLAVGQLLEPQRIGERIIETFARHLLWHHVTIRLVRPDTDELELIALNQPGLSDENRLEMERYFNTMISKIGQGMSGWVVQTGTSIRTGNVHEHPQYVNTYPGIQSGLYMPLKVGERVIGVISVESEEPDALTAQDERLLATLANQAAIAFENARLYQSAQQEIAERKRVENKLRESQERYRLLIETSPDGVIMMSMDGTIQFSNLQMADLFNVEDSSELVGTNILSLFSPEEREHVERNIGNHNLLEDGPQDGRWLLRQDSSQFYGELRSSTLRNDKGEPYAVIAQLRDVTERKQSQEAIQEERQRFLDLFENSPNPTWLEDFTAVIAWMDELRTNGITDLGKYLNENPNEYRAGVGLIRILNVNHAAVIVNGARDKKELIDKVHELMYSEEPSRVMIYELEMIWQGNTSFGFEMSSPRMDGSVITGIQRIYIPTKNNQPDYARVIVTSTDITERVEIERMLRASELHYRELADSITDILFELDHDLRYTHWNKASEIMMGIPAYNAIGKSMYEIFGDSEEQSRIGKIYRSVLEENQPKTFETEILIQGQKLVFEINANPSMRGVSVVARNITERKLSETLMQKRFELVEYSAHHTFEEVLQKTIDVASELTGSHIGFMHFVKDDQTNIEIQAWSTETFREFCDIEEMDKHYAVDQSGVWADAVRQRRPIIHNDYESLPNKKGLPQGHAKVIREMVIPIIRNERIVAVLGVGNKESDYTRQNIETAERFADYAWDITERKQMESALAEERNQLAKRVEDRTADLSRANSNLARALRVKDEFLANMSHELRTPLNAILGLSESLGEQVAGPLNEKQQKYLSTINESGHHLLSLINDILDLAKIEAGQITLDINKVDVNSVCQASLRMVKQLAQKKNQEVVFEIESDLGLMWADERRLKQMIVNLLSNAVKFTPESGRIGLEIHGDRAGNKVIITVWDTGIGIREQDLERLFKPFVQLDSGLAREATGTGLGLALVAQMARLHGGSVHALSQPGEGSRFVIQLPWEPAMAGDIAARLRNTGKFRAIDPNGTRPTILLIEDTREVVMMLVDYLEMTGFKMVTAQDGIDGLEQARLAHPDLILMDIQMPRMDGFETTQKLRSDPKFRDIPIIALTALAMPNDRQRCLDAGMDEYISKPVNLKALAKMIHKLLYQDQDVKAS